jgi:hypothetical protein
MFLLLILSRYYFNLRQLFSEDGKYTNDFFTGTVGRHSAISTNKQVYDCFIISVEAYSGCRHFRQPFWRLSQIRRESEDDHIVVNSVLPEQP